MTDTWSLTPETKVLLITWIQKMQHCGRAPVTRDNLRDTATFIIEQGWSSHDHEMTALVLSWIVPRTAPPSGADDVPSGCTEGG